ncbi:pseudaminic acid cytidylyltransferase [Ekhidna sp.]
MSNICIIPARGGSKRIPRKNIKQFFGKPIISYSIEVAKRSQLFDEIMVSTDDEEIAKIAKENGAKVPFLRSAERADDFTTTAEVLVEVLDRYKELDKSFKYVCCLYPAAPLVSFEGLIQGFNKLHTEKRDSVLPVTSFTYPIWRSLRQLSNGSVELIWPNFQDSRSQDLEKTYHDTGQWYWLNYELFIHNKKLFTKNSGMIELSQMEVQDIDELTDWKMAELKYEILQNTR